jgi:hypothetical protein
MVVRFRFMPWRFLRPVKECGKGNLASQMASQ